MMDKLTAAVAQTASVLLDTPATMDRALTRMAEAAKQGATFTSLPTSGCDVP